MGTDSQRRHPSPRTPWLYGGRTHTRDLCLSLLAGVRFLCLWSYGVEALSFHGQTAHNTFVACSLSTFRPFFGFLPPLT